MSKRAQLLRTVLVSFAAMAVGGGAALYGGCSSGITSSEDEDEPNNNRVIGNDPGATITAFQACNPLAPQPTKLGRILGVGKDSASTLYLVDQVAAAGGAFQRVFILRGNTLERLHVLGTATSGALPDADFMFLIDDPTADAQGERNLLLQVRDGVGSAIAFGPTDSKSFYAPDAAGDVDLKLLDRSVVDYYKVQDSALRIAFLADAADGTAVVVIAPVNDAEVDPKTAYAVFYGPPHAMIQRPITQLDADGFGAYISFTVSGATYVANFTYTFGIREGGGPIPGTLNEGAGKSLTLTQRVPPQTTLDGFAFTCVLTGQSE